MRSRPRSTHWSGFSIILPLTRTRLAWIQLRASVREPTPALENTRSRVFRRAAACKVFGGRLLSDKSSISLTLLLVLQCFWETYYFYHIDSRGASTDHVAWTQGASPRAGAGGPGRDQRWRPANS